MSIYERARQQHEAHKAKRYPADRRIYVTCDRYLKQIEREKRLGHVTDEDRALAAHWLADATRNTRALAYSRRDVMPSDLRQDLIHESKVSLRAAEHYRLGLM